MSFREFQARFGADEQRRQALLDARASAARRAMALSAVASDGMAARTGNAAHAGRKPA